VKRKKRPHSQEKKRKRYERAQTKISEKKVGWPNSYQRKKKTGKEIVTPGVTQKKDSAPIHLGSKGGSEIALFSNFGEVKKRKRQRGTITWHAVPLEEEKSPNARIRTRKT